MGNELETDEIHDKYIRIVDLRIQNRNWELQYIYSGFNHYTGALKVMHKIKLFSDALFHKNEFVSA